MKGTWLGFLCILIAIVAIGCQATDDEQATSRGGGLSPNTVNAAALDDSGADESGGCCKGCQPVAPDPWPQPDLTAGPSTVGFDSELFFTVNGQRFFPIGFYRAPQDEPGLTQFKNEGFNVSITGPSCCGSGGLQNQIDFLELAANVGVMIILSPWSPRDQVLTRPEAELEAELDARNNVGSLFGWYTFDEPGLHLPDKTLTGRMHEVLSTYDPDHMDGLVDAPLNDFSLYVDDCAFFMVDPYPSNWVPLVYVKATIEEAQKATEGLKPIVGVTQAFSWDWYHGMTDNEYHPDGLEMRNMTWQFIVLGARGLIPWNYAGSYTIHYQPEIWATYLETVAEINALAGVILASDANLDLLLDATIPTLFDYVVKQEATATWILSVSESERSQKAQFDLSALGADLCVVDYTTGETFAQDDNGSVTVAYGPLQTRILEILE